MKIRVMHPKPRNTRDGQESPESRRGKEWPPCRLQRACCPPHTPIGHLELWDHELLIFWATQVSAPIPCSGSPRKLYSHPNPKYHSKDMNKCFKKIMQIINKHMKMCSKATSFQEMQILKLRSILFLKIAFFFLYKKRKISFFKVRKRGIQTFRDKHESVKPSWKML